MITDIVNSQSNELFLTKGRSFDWTNRMNNSSDTVRVTPITNWYIMKTGVSSIQCVPLFNFKWLQINRRKLIWMVWHIIPHDANVIEDVVLELFQTILQPIILVIRIITILPCGESLWEINGASIAVGTVHCYPNSWKCSVHIHMLHLCETIQRGVVLKNQVLQKYIGFHGITRIIVHSGRNVIRHDCIFFTESIFNINKKLNWTYLLFQNVSTAPQSLPRIPLG